MSLSYNGLWKLLIDKNMNKVDLMHEVGISSGTVAKMTKGEPVSMAILVKICDRLDCDFGDIVHYSKETTGIGRKTCHITLISCQINSLSLRIMVGRLKGVFMTTPTPA